MHMQTQLMLSMVKKGRNKHEDTPIRITDGAKPSNVLWVLADVVMSRRCIQKQLWALHKGTNGKGILPVGRLLTIAIGTGWCGSCNRCGRNSLRISPSSPWNLNR